MQIDEAAVQELEVGLHGPLLRPGEEAYDRACQLWNGSIQKRPALIACCTGVADVVDAVGFARDQHLELAVKSGGHGVAGTALCDDGLVIDLSAMKGIRVDPSSRQAWVQPGVTWADLDRDTLAFELVLPGGIVSTTGIAGFTLGGGIGWLSRQYGLTCDNLLSADVVTADSRFVTASASQYSDLFWGLRGGGGNFGVVTSFHYRLGRISKLVTAGFVLYPFESAREVLLFFRQFADALPESASVMATLRIAPLAPHLPRELAGQMVVGITVCHTGSRAEGRRTTRPLKTFGQPLVDTIGPKPYRSLQCMLDPSQPPGRGQYWKSEYLAGISDRLVDTVVGFASKITSPHSLISFFQLGGAMGRIGDQDTAYSHRDASFLLTIGSSWENPSESEPHMQWTQDFWKAVLEDSSEAGYLNFLSADEGQERVRASYGPEKYGRLVKLKRKYDLNNLFRVNHNIRP